MFFAAHHHRRHCRRRHRPRTRRARVNSRRCGKHCRRHLHLRHHATQGIKPPSAREAIGVAEDVCSILDDGGDLLDAVSAVADYTDLELRGLGVLTSARRSPSYCPEHEDADRRVATQPRHPAVRVGERAALDAGQCVPQRHRDLARLPVGDGEFAVAVLDPAPPG